MVCEALIHELHNLHRKMYDIRKITKLDANTNLLRYIYKHINIQTYKHILKLIISFLTAPTDRLFEQFRERFHGILVDNNNLRLWQWPDDFPAHQPYTFLTTRAIEVKAWAEDHLMANDFGRDDYRKLCELMIKFLGGQVSI